MNSVRCWPMNSRASQLLTSCQSLASRKIALELSSPCSEDYVVRSHASISPSRGCDEDDNGRRCYRCVQAALAPWPQTQNCHSSQHRYLFTRCLCDNKMIRSFDVGRRMIALLNRHTPIATCSQPLQHGASVAAGINDALYMESTNTSKRRKWQQQ